LGRVAGVAVAEDEADLWMRTVTAWVFDAEWLTKEMVRLLRMAQ
jgi:hypothetical protein